MKNKLKICVIASHKNFYVPDRLMAAGRKRGHDMHITTWEDLYINLESGKIFIGDKKKNIANFDAIIPRSDRYTIKLKNKRVSRHLDTLFRLTAEYAKSHKIFFLNHIYFSEYQSIDKLTQQFFFSQNNLPGIPTFYASDIKKLKRDIKTFPLVAKIAQGSMGKSVYKLNNIRELNKFIDERNKKQEFYMFQKYFEINCDYRVIVVDDKALGIMKRSPRNKTEWRTNFSLGGKISKSEKDPAMEKLSISTAKKMGLDYAGIDILKHKGKLHIIETNSLPQFRGFETVFPEVNVAGKIIKMVESRVKKIRK